MVNVLAVGPRVGESFVTLGTLERFFSAVEPFVFRQVVFVFESLVAVRTFVRTQIWKLKLMKLKIIYNNN